MNDKSLGTVLKEQRVKKGLNQKELADKLSISHQAISRWENNYSLPDIKTLIAISKLYNITLEQLVKPGEINFKDDKPRKHIYILITMVMSLLAILSSSSLLFFYDSNQQEVGIILYLFIVGTSLILSNTLYFTIYKKSRVLVFLLLSYGVSIISFLIWVLVDSGIID